MQSLDHITSKDTVVMSTIIYLTSYRSTSKVIRNHKLTTVLDDIEHFTDSKNYRSMTRGREATHFYSMQRFVRF